MAALMAAAFAPALTGQLWSGKLGTLAAAGLLNIPSGGGGVGSTGMPVSGSGAVVVASGGGGVGIVVVVPRSRGALASADGGTSSGIAPASGAPRGAGLEQQRPKTTA